MTDAHDPNEQLCPMNQPCVENKPGDHRQLTDHVEFCVWCLEACQCSLIAAVRAESRNCDEKACAIADRKRSEGYAAAVDEAIRRVEESVIGKGYVYSDTETGLEWAIDALTAMKEES